MPSRHEGPENVRQAWNGINNAVRDGKVKKPKSCQGCGKKRVLQAHHKNYNRPLDVKWLCLACHAGEKGKAKNGPKGKFRDENRKK